MNFKRFIKSMITGLMEYVIAILIGFVARSIFIKTLGTEWLGLNGLFDNILSLLNMVETGFGTAIIVHLYRAVRKDNKEKIKSLMLFYKTIYRIVALIITVLGIVIMPFLKLIVGEVSINANIYFIFSLYLMDTVISYLFSYKKSILYATQKTYYINIIHVIYTILMNAAQIYFLLKFKNFILYLVIKIVFRLIENIVVSHIADKQYPYINDKDVKKLSARQKKSIYLKVKGLVFHRISSFVTNGTDNIIISATKSLGVVVVGLYSNYYLIINTLSNLLSRVFSSLTPSIGNLMAENNRERSYDIFNKTLLMNTWIYTYVAISLYFVSKPFVKLWLGESFLLPDHVVLILVLYFYINGVRITYNMFKETAGIFYEDRWIAVIQATTNLVTSIILVNIIGLAGVFLGTLISVMVVYIYTYPKYIYKKLFNKSVKEYILKNGEHVLIFFVSFLLTYLATSLIKVNNNFISLVLNIGICLIIPNLLYIIVKHNTKEFKYYLDTLKNFKRKMFN